jgi:DNA polymerase|nr:MAG TPA: DNA polymerase I [Caudoviricetes sp.]
MSDFWAAEPVFLVPDPRDLTDEQIGVLCDVKKAMGRNIDLAGPDWPLDPRRPAIGLFGVEGPWTAPADGGFDEIWPLVLQGRWTVTASEKGGAPWVTQDVLWIDIETYSPVDLAKAGVYKYTEHPDWRILMCSWALNDDKVQRAEGHEAILEIPGLFDGQILKIAHNASFERVNLSRLKNRGRKGGKFLPPEQFFDTAALARTWGLPASLEDFAISVGAEEKDEAGTRLINLFSKPNRNGERVTKEERPDDWAAFGAYCDQDVETMRDAAKMLGRGFPRGERAVYEADQRINDRGVRVDTALAEAAERCFKDNRSEALKEIEKIAGVDNGNSVTQLRTWLKSRGVDTEDLRKDTVKELLEGDLPDDVRRVLVLRQECAVSAAAKFTAAIRATNDDGRLRGTMQYFGASTGRFAGRLIQFQNLARDGFKGPDRGYDTTAEEAAVGRLLEGGSIPSPELKKLIRPLLMGPFVVCDYSSIEPRVLAWLAGEQWMIDAFNNNEDIYVATAAKLGGPEKGFDRQHGKLMTLSCGYKGGVGAALKMGGRNIMPKGTPEDILRKELQAIINNWRDKSPAVRRFWSQLERILGTGGGVDTGLVSIEVKGQDRYVWLPSKRPIVYRGLTRRWKQPLDVDGTPLGPARLAPHVLNTGGDRARVPYKPLHGGIITENIVQAVARDILVAALRRLEEAGWPVVTHIHDEVVCEIPADKRSLGEAELVAEVSEIMCRPPSWADDDLVIKAAGYTCQRYHKE